MNPDPHDIIFDKLGEYCHKHGLELEKGGRYIRCIYHAKRPSSHKRVVGTCWLNNEGVSFGRNKKDTDTAMEFEDISLADPEFFHKSEQAILLISNEETRTKMNQGNDT